MRIKWSNWFRSFLAISSFHKAWIDRLYFWILNRTRRRWLNGFRFGHVSDIEIEIVVHHGLDILNGRNSIDWLKSPDSWAQWFTNLCSYKWISINPLGKRKEIQLSILVSILFVKECGLIYQLTSHNEIQISCLRTNHWFR